MTIQEVTYSERTACSILDEWLDVTGSIPLNSGYHSELESIITDAVHIGIQMALYGKIKKTKDGNIDKDIKKLTTH